MNLALFTYFIPAAKETDVADYHVVLTSRSVTMTVTATGTYSEQVAATGTLRTIEEVGVYTVGNDDKITREQFYYDGEP